MRECHNMSQSQLAGKLWLDRSSISGYEIGKRMPDILILWEMAEIMNVSLDELVGRKKMSKAVGL
ncbi:MULTISPECIES: helix-turn-helix domain-containing protein [unclassified Dorea]|uniref:helix-turn-helix domain-containing protein n=1 Tax=unclassified Dorea TaxID=2627917 RepID=UPI00241C01EC|nr:MULTISPECIES: helix-turn-helix transcriptional regulator [unclassified Dorea]